MLFRNMDGQIPALAEVTRSDVDQPLKIVQGQGLVGHSHEMKHGYAMENCRTEELSQHYNEKFDLPTCAGLRASIRTEKAVR